MRSSTVWGPLVALGFGGAVLTPLVRADAPKEGAATAASSTDASPPSSSGTAPPVSPVPPASSVVAPSESAAPSAPTASVAPKDKEPAVEPPRGAWYGYQGLVASLAVSGATIAAYRSFDSDKRVPLLLSAITLQIALTPWIHLGHGNHRAVGRSLALQASLVAGGALLGAYAVQGLAGCPGPQSPCDRLDQTDFAALGGLIGAIVAPAVDAGWLAFEPTSSAAPKAGGVAIAPTFSLARPVAGARSGPTGAAVVGGVVGVAGLF